MKKILLSVALLTFVQGLYAADKPATLADSLHTNTFDIGPDAYYYRYREPDLMKETGYFYGFQAAYTYRQWVPNYPPEESVFNWMFRAEGRLDWGSVDYDGAIVNLETGETQPYSYDNKHDSTGEFRLLIGPDFPKKTVLDTIYAGLGYRFLDDNKSGDPFGYDRHSHYVYLPVGFETLRKIFGNWLLSTNVEFDVFLWGRQSSDFGDVTIHNDQHNGYGLRGSVGLEYNTKDWGISIQPFIRYWNIGKSEETSFRSGDFIITAWEPKNNTTEIGLDLIFKF
jgi:hypothetical protein